MTTKNVPLEPTEARKHLETEVKAAKYLKESTVAVSVDHLDTLLKASPPSGGEVYQRLAQIAVYGDVWFDISRETYEATKDQGITRVFNTSPRVVDDWQPIETAPKDGSMFIGWVSAVKCGEHDEGGYFEVDVSEPDFCVFKASEHGGYVDALSGPRADREQVTHWKPLPTPPALQAALGEGK